MLVYAPVLGAILGSFSTMLVYRLHHDETGVWLGRSRCPQCRQQLGWKNLIPIFSWLFQGGKCAFCRKEIPVIYPVIEIAFATVFFLFVQKFSSTELLWMLPIVFLLLVLFFYDLWFMEVDDRIAWPAIGIAGLAIWWRDVPYAEHLIAGGLGFLFYAAQFYGSKGRWVGAGDMRFGLLLGLLFGWQTLLVLLVSYVVGTIVGLGLVFTKDYGPKSQLPMGAFLMPVAIIFLYLGNGPWNWYLDYLGFA